MQKLWVTTSCMAMATLIGCSGIKVYSSAGPENLFLHTKLDSGSTLTRLVADLDLYRLNGQCEAEYLGRVFLDKPDVRAAIPPEKPLYFSFIFTSKGVLSPNMRSARYDTWFTPRPGFEYSVQAAYDKGIYDVVIRESRRGSATSRVIERKPLSACHG